MNTQTKAWGAFILLSVIWGSSFLFIKIAVEDLTPLTLVSLRLLSGAAAMWIFFALSDLKFPTDRRLIIIPLLLGITNTALPFFLITWAEETISSSVAGVLNSAVPLFTIVIAHFALADERITWLRGGGLIAGFSGVLIIFSNDLLAFFDAESVSNWPVLRGQLMILLATVFYAGSTVLIRKRLSGKMPSLTLTTLTVSGAFMFILVATLIVDWPLSLAMRPITVFSLLWLGILGTGVAYLLYYYVLKTWDATRTTLVTYLIPVFAVILGFVFLKEEIGWQLIAGFVLIAAGITLVNYKPSGE